MKKILVPTDFSTEAGNALKVAAQFAKMHDSKIYLLHIVELPTKLITPVTGTYSNSPPEVMYFLKLAEKKLSEEREKEFMQGLRVQEIILFNQAFDGIMEASKEQDCDLIVMGSKGASGFKEMFIGSNTEKVVRSSEIPVLVIKNPHPEFRVDNMVFATELSEGERNALRQAVRFAKQIEAKLHLVHINTGDGSLSAAEMDREMENFMREENFDRYTTNSYDAKSVEDGILNFAKKINANLVGMATHGRKGLSHFFNGSISEDLVNHAERPVITFRL